MMKARRNKNAPFWHHWNGGRGGPGVSFILSKIAILDRIKWNNYPPSPPPQSNNEGAKEQKQNKMEQLSPIPPKAMMKVGRSKNAPFWHH